MISAKDVQRAGARDSGDPAKVALTVELARQLFAARGSTLGVANNPLTRSLRVTARLPLV